jgi:Outer membrane protein beta-barrel domain
LLFPLTLAKQHFLVMAVVELKLPYPLCASPITPMHFFYFILNKTFMKILLTGALAAILLTGTATAQKVNLGIKAGLNLYNINNDNNVEYDTRTGFNVGLLGHIHLAPQLALQPEIVYSSQGAKFSVSNVETNINLGYINVPVLVQYMFDNGFRLQAGPQLGFLVNAKSKTNSVETDIKNNLQTVDFAVGGGVGYVHPASGFGVDARYNLGLSNINENGSLKSTNRGFQLGVFYLFQHKN